MPMRPEFLTQSVIVAAHPDDELLWFNAILKEVDEVIIVFRPFWAHPDLASKRAAALAAFPRKGVSCLDLHESGAYGCANWLAPEETSDGLALTMESQKREWKRFSKRALQRAGIPFATVADRSVLAAYRQNTDLLRNHLRGRLRPGMNVFTHNPWGEYGHEEHVQVFRVLQSLRAEIGFNLWMSNYCTERSLPLAMRYFETSPGPYIRLPTDKAFAQTVAQVYKDHDCWTWASDWSWFDEECYMPAPMAGQAPKSHRHLFPLNLFSIGDERPRQWLPALGAAAISAALVTAIEI
jgi:LmbE family N-acetylglucosaminyl deacetylase